MASRGYSPRTYRYSLLYFWFFVWPCSRYQIPGMVVLTTIVRHWLVYWLALAALAEVFYWLIGGTIAGPVLGFCPNGTVFIVGTANGQFWRSAIKLVLGTLESAGSLGADVALVVGVASHAWICGAGGGLLTDELMDVAAEIRAKSEGFSPVSLLDLFGYCVIRKGEKKPP